jgi:hypothetical protein
MTSQRQAVAQGLARALGAKPLIRTWWFDFGMTLRWILLDGFWLAADAIMRLSFCFFSQLAAKPGAGSTAQLLEFCPRAI